MTTSYPHVASADELDQCAREAIHQIPLVQSHGFVLACELDTGLLRFHSGNLGQHLRLAATPVSLAELTDEPLDQLLPRLASVAPGAPAPFRFGFCGAHGNAGNFEVMAHRAGDLVLLETLPFERPPDQGEYHDGVDQLERAVRTLGALNRHEAMSSFLQASAEELRRLSGYSRVMIYRFLPDWSGEVIAEATEPGVVERFIGLRFPASDIPPQARDLYTRNLLRVVADVDAEATPLVAHRPGDVLDQSHSLLRNPSPMHLRYLRNMGVRATLTISLLEDGKLWGMVACHHHVPKAPPVELRRMTQLLCALIAESTLARLASMQRREAVERQLALKGVLGRVIRTLSASTDFNRAAASLTAELCAPLRVAGVGLMVDGLWVLRPDAPEALLELATQGVMATGQAAAAKGPGGTAGEVATGGLLFETDQLGTLSPDAASWRPWAGLLATPLPNLSGRHLLVLLRHELPQTVHWAGAPDKQILTLPDGQQVLGPRQSFDHWAQLVQGQSEPWSDEDRTVAVEIAKTLAEATLLHRGRSMQADLHMLASCMERLSDMIIITDARSGDDPGERIQYVNQAFIDATGYTRDEVLGRTPRLLQGPETDRAVSARLREAIAQWKSLTVELINYTKLGEPYWAEITVGPITDASGWHTHWVAIGRKLDDRKNAERNMHRLVHYDTLTGLPNRQLLADRLYHALQTSARFGHNGALLYIDLDHFKTLNDSAGHYAGDELLRQVSERLGAAVRREDTVARLGGDEFVVLLESLSARPSEAAATCQHVAEDLVSRLGQDFELSGQVWSGSASVGVAMFHDGHDYQIADEVLRQAEVAMYQAKSAGRNSWRLFDAGALRAAEADARLELELRDALASGQLQLALQAQVDGEGQAVGRQARLGWQHPERGWLSADEFADAAERRGLAAALGQFMLQQACARLALWAASPGTRDWTLDLSVGSGLLRHPRFTALVQAALDEAGVDPSRLRLGLTEVPHQAELEPTLAKLLTLQALGVQFAVDDFGAGQAAIADLRRLPLAALGIAARFTADVETDADQQGICKAVVALGKALKLDVVAQGVGTEAAFRQLRKLGCRRFAGHLFSNVQ